MESTTRFQPTPIFFRPPVGQVEVPPVVNSLLGIGLTMPEINSIIRADDSVKELAIHIDEQGTLHGELNDFATLMTAMRFEGHQPEPACILFLACPLAAKKHLVMQPWFSDLKEPQTADDKNHFLRRLCESIVDAQNNNEEFPIFLLFW